MDFTEQTLGFRARADPASARIDLGENGLGPQGKLLLAGGVLFRCGLVIEDEQAAIVQHRLDENEAAVASLHHYRHLVANGVPRPLVAAEKGRALGFDRVVVGQLPAENVEKEVVYCGQVIVEAGQFAPLASVFLGSAGSMRIDVDTASRSQHGQTLAEAVHLASNGVGAVG